MRAQAQLELSQMHAYTRPTQIRNRCIDGGKGRGVFRDFHMARVSLHSPTPPAMCRQVLKPNACTVLLSNERSSRQSTRRQKSQLVMHRLVGVYSATARLLGHFSGSKHGGRRSYDGKAFQEMCT